jgi:hypothetical protein
MPLPATSSFNEFDLRQRIERLQQEEVRLRQVVTSREQYHKKLKEECDDLSAIRETIRANVKDLKEEESKLLKNSDEIYDKLCDDILLEVTRRSDDIAEREAQLEADLAAMAELRPMPNAISQDDGDPSSKFAVDPSLQEELNNLRSGTQRHKKQIDCLRREKRELLTRCDEAESLSSDLEKKLNSQRTKLTRIDKSVALQTGVLFAHCPAVQQWIASLETTADDLGWSDEVASVGDEPFQLRFVDHVLIRHGFTPVECGAAQAEVLIVGRDKADFEQVEKQIDARERRPLRVYSQEMALLALFTGHDPFDAGDEALTEMGQSHPVLSRLMHDAFEWPALHRKASSRTVVIGEDWNPNSPLTAMGYHVGRDFGNARQRRAILRDIVEGELSFPRGTSRATKSEWGDPGSKARLLRIADQFRRNFNLSGKKYTHQQAADHWKADYNWLKENYGRAVKFRWPRL